MKLTGVPGLPAERADLAGFIDFVGELLEKGGGKITDVGYCFPGDYAELVVRAPDGTSIELRAKVIRREDQHCPGCDGGHTGSGPCEGI